MGVYENTLEEIKTTYGSIPGFLKLLPKDSLVKEWISWKKLDELELERASYLLTIDEMYYESPG